MTKMIFALVLTGFIFSPVLARADQASDTYDMIDALGETLSLIQLEAANPPSLKETIQGALQGALNTVDSHSTYMAPAVFTRIENTIEGSFGGIGVYVKPNEKGPVIARLVKGGPADKAGMKEGDIILRIDETDLISLPFPVQVQNLQGRIGDKTHILVWRDGQEKSFDILRKKVIIPPQPSKIIEGYGYISIPVFNRTAADNFKQTVADIKKENGNKPLRGWIIDLRNDLGGLVSASVDIASAILDGGVITTLKGKKGLPIETQVADKGDILDGLPLAILVNKNTASASEIMVGAIQDHKRGIAVGTTTYGKGSVQNIFPIGELGAIKFTIALYYTPNGRNFEGHGLTPDVISDGKISYPFSDNADIKAAVAAMNHGK